MIWVVESGLNLKLFPGHKVNMIPLATILTNNNIFVIVSIKLTGNVWYIHSEKFFKTHGDHEYDINLVLFFPDKYSFDTGWDYSTCRFFI